MAFHIRILLLLAFTGPQAEEFRPGIMVYRQRSVHTNDVMPKSVHHPEKKMRWSFATHDTKLCFGRFPRPLGHN